MTANKPEVKRYDCTSGGAQYCYGCYTMEEDELGDYVEWEAYKALQAECDLLREQLDAMEEYKMAARHLIGIPASVGICEPIEGFTARPQDILPAVRDMALKIEALQAENEQLLTDEHKAILKECRNQAMRWTLDARIPEAGAFGGIAQDLDYLCAQLGVKND